jgi:hypothetical protein
MPSTVQGFARVPESRNRGTRTGQRGLGNIGGDNALATAVLGGLEDLGLQVGRHLRVDRQDSELGRLLDLRESLCASLFSATACSAGQRAHLA